MILPTFFHLQPRLQTIHYTIIQLLIHSTLIRSTMSRDIEIFPAELLRQAVLRNYLWMGEIPIFGRAI